MASKKHVELGNSNFSEFVKNPFTRIIGAITAVSSIFLMGFGFGQYNKRLDFQVEKLELKQDCNERVQTEINNCREQKLAEYGKTVEDMKSVLKEMQKK